MSVEATRVYEFDGHTLDLWRGSVWRGDREVELRPKCYLLLRYLAENAGRLVSKEELMRVIWPNVAVTDDSLSRCVCDLRLALRDSAQKIIKTVRARGFLFNGPPLYKTHASEDLQTSRLDDVGKGGDPSVGEPALFGGLALPLIDQIRSTTALRAAAYEGFYQSTRPYSAGPGQYVHDQMLVRMGPDGILRLKMATGGVLVEGWVLPVHTQLYVIGTEFGSGGLVFAILHGVNSIKADVLDGVTLSSTFDVGRTPAASAIVLQRVGELTGDPIADDARLLALGAGNPVVPKESVSESLRRHLARDTPAVTPGLIDDGVLRLPLRESRSRSADFDPE